MIRTQIQLTEDQAHALRRSAALKGVSMAAIIREAVDRAVAEDDEDARWERAIRSFGAFTADASDIAEDHDRYLDAAYGEW